MPHTKLILETRYDPKGKDGKPDKNRKFPVRLRISEVKDRYYISIPKKKFTKEEWEKMHGKKPSEELKKELIALNAIEGKAAEDIAKLPRFTINAFKALHDSKSTVNSRTLEYHFKRCEAGFWGREKVKTAQWYKNAFNSLDTFRPNMMLIDITGDLLKDYQFWMKKEGNSLTTVSFYMRALRAVINKALDTGEFPSERRYYPFGKNKYKIPAPLQKKKTLTIDQLTKLVNYKTKDQEKAFARDIFLFSYYCGGPNPVDIAKFRYEWIKGKHIHFPPRSKTEETNPNQEPIPPVPIDGELQKIIDKWKVGKPTSKGYVFGILNDKLDAKQIVECVNGFNKRINAGLRDIAKDDLKFNCTPTMGYARATQANNLLKAGVSVEDIAKHMGHASPKTTKNYLKQLPDDLQNNTLAKLRLPKLKAV